MGKRRPSGDGMVRKRDDGRWEGRIVVGHKANGDPIFRHVYAKTQKALTEKLHQSIECYSPTWIDGKKHARNVYAHTREECEEKLKVLIAEMKAELAELKRQKGDRH
jgi:hypothetical protein